MVLRTLPVEATGRRTWWAGAVSVVAGTGAIVGHASYYDSWLIDDAAITFAYARSVTEGYGPVVQAGAEPVEGYSNPAWLLLLAAGRLFGLFDRGTVFGVPDYVLFPKVLAALCCAGILTICYFLARRVTSRPAVATLSIGAVLALIPSFVIWCFSGLENPLFTLAVVGLAALLFHATRGQRLAEVAAAAGLICALAALTRPDGLIYLLAYPLLVRRLKPVLVYLGAFAIPFGAYMVWRLSTFGLLVPNTAVAKRQGLPAPQDLLRVWDLIAYVGVPATVVLGVVLIGGRRIEAIGAVFVPLGLAVGAYVLLEPDWMAQYRFATPVWALAVIAGVLCSTALPRRPVVVVIMVGTLVLAGSNLAGAAQRFRADPTFPMCLVADRFGRMFNHYADILGVERGSLLLPDLGGSAMTTRLRLVDMAGLADERIARYTRDGDMAGLRDYVFDQVKPTFVTSHGIWDAGTGVALDPRLRADYHAIHQDGSSSDWVRKDVVGDMDRLARARDYASNTMPTVDSSNRDLPRRACGGVLRTGQIDPTGVNAAEPR